MGEVSLDLAELEIVSEDLIVGLDLTPPLFFSGFSGKSPIVAFREMLRLDQAPSRSSALDIAHGALLDARLTFFRRLGIPQVGKILEHPHVAAPANEGQVLRAVAASTEILMVRSQLLRSLRHMTIDGSTPLDEWNQQGFARETPEVDIDAEIGRLALEISENLELLSGDEKVGEETVGIQVSTFEGEGSKPRLGDSIKPDRQTNII